jgi:hypothetical protein
MFGINKSSNQNAKNTDEYIAVSSLIEDGTVLDRRKPRNDRRLNPERREILGGFISGVENRVVKIRRKVSSRRDFDQTSKDVVENIDDLELTASNVQGLIREQILLIEKIGKLSISVKEKEFQGIKEKIQKYTEEVRLHVQKEQHFLHLYLDIEIKDYSGEEIGSSLSDFNSDIYTVSGQVLQLLEKFTVSEVKDENAGFFLMDMNKVRGKLSTCLEKKQNHLYPKYFAL